MESVQIRLEYRLPFAAGPVAFVQFFIDHRGAHLLDFADLTPAGDFGLDVVFEWAKGCTLEGLPPVPPGWRLVLADDAEYSPCDEGVCAGQGVCQWCGADAAFVELAEGQVH